mmetsp:Transcript_49452/g.92097  ORF Transcript_49452/g.92097 Transcript_49452/m.92097 type:complete len:237 (-) Transcript_49452:1051-1761(-)
MGPPERSVDSDGYGESQRHRAQRDSSQPPGKGGGPQAAPGQRRRDSIGGEGGRGEADSGGGKLLCGGGGARTSQRDAEGGDAHHRTSSRPDSRLRLLLGRLPLPRAQGGRRAHQRLGVQAQPQLHRAARLQGACCVVGLHGQRATLQPLSSWPGVSHVGAEQHQLQHHRHHRHHARRAAERGRESRRRAGAVVRCVGGGGQPARHGGHQLLRVPAARPPTGGAVLHLRRPLRQRSR